MSGSIGPHNFVHLLGNVPVIQQRIEVLTKPGEDGHRRRRLGTRSTNFTLESMGTYDSRNEAREALSVFGQMPDGAAVPLTKDGFNHTTDNDEEVKVAVLHVRQLELRKTAGNTTGRDWLLRCEWSLRLVPVVA